ncbi:uncharacterized protein ColSpa_04340 [Colletotrichum spaethianum]|uniref:Uncharacterized protein n=1 Tax=Colletotrichum spaethianum TaxID=700344 RepID=A0AA37LCR4_9PEZI|nr:uncharacterized protein ColSpa_04340 [Colletotrichum spaethianum]GKT44159.1 hypothetical protein ColSpa_04340 [Colletotrichum spaethianum]
MAPHLPEPSLAKDPRITIGLDSDDPAGNKASFPSTWMGSSSVDYSLHEQPVVRVPYARLQRASDKCASKED